MVRVNDVIACTNPCLLGFVAFAFLMEGEFCNKVSTCELFDIITYTILSLQYRLSSTTN